MDQLVNLIIGVNAVGLMANTTEIVFLVKTRKSKKFYSRMDVVQTSVDLLSNFVTIAPYLSINSTPYYSIWNEIRCSTLRTQTMLWVLISIRAQLNTFLAIYLYIKLLFPFMKIQDKTKSFVAIMLATMTFSALISVFPHVFELTHNVDLGECVSYREHAFDPTKRTGLFLSITVLFSVVQNFISPMFLTTYFYQKVFTEYRTKEKSASSTVYKEVRFLSTVNTTLFITCHCFSYMAMVLGRFLNKLDFTPDSQVFNAAVICSSAYPTMRPIVSLFYRKSYRHAISEPLLKCFEKVFPESQRESVRKEPVK
ncbi:hypothetical protein CSKR_110712 [Clonorchis sinensis]|uniref:G-protein coupled receptors family 1 profile domain-containing protein n=1 Tax=Clonorchis sinensis TaxID=79923 RepID=A0A3R7CV49_CLOSI|nr:hypothetical protein CSKR_110712 [Clonorchis sinensis]